VTADPPDARPVGSVARAVLGTYPPSFRERYGDELQALVEDTGAGPRVLADLLAGSARAWLCPSFAGDARRVARRRLATVSTVWVCWCALFVATPAVLRLVEDPPPAGYHPDNGGWGVVHDAVSLCLVLGWLLVLAVGVPVGLRALRSAAVRRAVLPPVALLVLCAVMFVPLKVYAARHWVAQGRPATAADIPLWWVLLALTFVVALGVDAVWGALAGAVALRRADVESQRLRAASLVAAALLVPMAVLVGLLTCVVVAGAGLGGAGVLAPVVAAAVVGSVVALAVAAVSAARGLRVAGAR
jgi:hypothetical protein